MSKMPDGLGRLQRHVGLRRIVPVLGLVAGLACGDEPMDPLAPVPTTITVSPASVEIASLAETARLTAYAFGEDLYWWLSRSGFEEFVCSDFEPSWLAILDVTAGPEKDRPSQVRSWTNSGRVDVAENGYKTTLRHVTVLRNSAGDVQHNVGFWPEPPENVLDRGDAGTSACRAPSGHSNPPKLPPRKDMQ